MEGGMEEFCLSLIPLHEGLGLRTYSPLRESLSLIIPSKSCRKVHTDKIFCFLPLSHPLCFCPSPSLSLLYFYIYIYIYSPPACHPSSDSNSISLSLPPCLCPTQFISVCLGILVSPFSLPSSSLLLLFLLLLTLSCVSPVQSIVDIMGLTSQSGSRLECCAGAYCLSTDAAGLQWDLCTALSILLTAFSGSFTRLCQDQAKKKCLCTF